MYKSFISHLHSIFEGPASISGYAYEANRFDIDVVWLTDHDGQIVPFVDIKKPWFKEWDCKKNNNPNLSFVEDSAKDASWDFSHASDEECFVFRAKGENKWAGGYVELTREKSFINRPLLSNPKIYMELDSNIELNDPDARFCLEITLSQTPPEHEIQYLYYYLGEPLEHSCSFSLAERRSGNGYLLDLTEDAQQAGSTLDHNVRNYRFVLESQDKEVFVKLKEFSLQTPITESEDWRKGQIKIAEECAKQYDVNIICGYEFSWGEYHMCYYGPSAPVFPYEENPNPTMEELTEYAHKNGGITSYNHPFAKWKREQLSDVEKDQIIKNKAEEIINRKAGGAHLIEVGYPVGRQGFDYHHYMKLWDILNLAGMKIYAVGVNDAHANHPWEIGREGNNYANYVQAVDCKPETFVAGLKAGHFYMVDPVAFQGKFSFVTNEGKTMGDKQPSGKVTIKLTKVPQGATLVWVIDGQKKHEEAVEGVVEAEYSLEGSHFIRAELRQADGRTIVLTNPIWLS